MADKVVFITSGTSWTVPADFSEVNHVECIGAGASGAASQASGIKASGGGGGAYARKDNLVLTPNSTVTVAIGAAAAGVTGNQNGIDGGDTCFGGATLATCTVGAEGGKKGGGNTGGSGGLAANSVGDIKFDGGAGGDEAGAFNSIAAGGGAAGPNGAGKKGGSESGGHRPGAGGGAANGGSVGVDSPVGTTGADGGDGRLGSGHGIGGAQNTDGGAATAGSGAGGGGGGENSGNITAGGDGATDAVWDATHGPGGGGGSPGWDSNGARTQAQGGNGALYGGGGSATGYGPVNKPSGAGAQGLIVVTYTPKPVADFTGTPTSGTAPLSVAFTDSSTNTPTSWLWEKNSGSGWVNFSGTPTVQNPTESFTAGTWSVRLTATNAAGSDTKTRTNYITPSAAATTRDTHDGAKPKRKPWYQRLEFVKEETDERARSYRSNREQLRRDILFAMDGPIEAETLDIIREHMEPAEMERLSAPDYEPELRGLLSQTEALRHLAALVLSEQKRQDDEDEEDIEMLLLH